MIDFDDALLWFRLAERMLLAVLFIGVSIFLLWIYRKDSASQTARFNGGAGAIAFELTKPFLAALLLLGYVYASLSNPILRETVPPVLLDAGERDSQTNERTLFFDDARLTRTYTELAVREERFERSAVVFAQSILALSLQIEALRDQGRGPEIEAILDDPDSSLADIRAAVGAL